MAALPKAIAAVFPDAHPFLLEVFGWLQEWRTQSILHRIIERILPQTDLKAVTDAVVVVAIWDHEHAEEWLDVITKVFKEKRYQNWGNEVSRQGLILGAFKAGLWLEANICRNAQTFADRLFESAVDFVLCQGDVFLNASQPSPAYERELSLAVRAFIKGREELHAVPKLVPLQRCLEKITQRARREELIDRDKLSKVGGLLLDQLSYALISYSHPIVRAETAAAGCEAVFRSVELPKEKE